MKIGHLMAAVAAAVFLAGSPQPRAQQPSRVTQLAESIRPRPSELRWQRIPWVLDLEEGIRLAKSEQRPLLLWATGDDPLERC